MTSEAEKNMDRLTDELNLSDEDLRAALTEMKTYVDITEEDLRKIYVLAFKHARERVVLNVRVAEIMVKNVVTAERETRIDEVIRLLADHNISGLPIVDDNKRVIGVVSEADIVSVTGLKRGHTFKEIMRHLLGEPLPERKGDSRAMDIMSAPAITVHPEEGLQKAARILDERRIKRLPVVDQEGRLLGIVSRADIVRLMGQKWNAFS